MNKLKKKSQQNNSGTTVQEKTQKKKQDNPFNIYKTQTINNGVASVFIGKELLSSDSHNGDQKIDCDWQETGYSRQDVEKWVDLQKYNPNNNTNILSARRQRSKEKKKNKTKNGGRYLVPNGFF